MIAANISRDAQYAQYTEEHEADSLHSLIVDDECDNVKTEHKYQPDRRAHTHENMEMRPRLRDHMHVNPPLPGSLMIQHAIAGNYQLASGTSTAQAPARAPNRHSPDDHGLA